MGDEYYMGDVWWLVHYDKRHGISNFFYYKALSLFVTEVIYEIIWRPCEYAITTAFCPIIVISPSIVA